MPNSAQQKPRARSARRAARVVSPLQALMHAERAQKFASGGSTSTSTPAADEILKEKPLFSSSPMETMPKKEAAPASTKSDASASSASTSASPTPVPKTLQQQSEEFLRRHEQARSEKQRIMDDAITRLQAKQKEGLGASDLFKLASAFGRPTKTGSFFETLSGASNVAGDIYARREGIDQEILKHQLAKADLSAEGSKELLELQKLSAPTSTHGKQAMDEGFSPGTVEFANRVKELAQQEHDLKVQKIEGREIKPGFDARTGNFLAKNGTVIKSNEVKEDREIYEDNTKLLQDLLAITDDDFKAAEGWDWTGSDTSKWLSGKIDPAQLAAQTKINTASLQQRLSQLPPGPASDKDIAQALSSFPKFADAATLKTWRDDTVAKIRRSLARKNDKYGVDTWRGAMDSGASDPDAASKEKATAGPKKGDRIATAEGTAVFDGTKYILEKK